MRALKSCNLPLSTRLSPYLTRGSGVCRRTLGAPLPKKPFRRASVLTVAFAFQHPSPSSSSPRHFSSTHSAGSAPTSRYTTPSSCTSILHLLRPFTATRRSWLARISTRRLRPFHLFSKKYQHQYYHEAQHSSYYADSFTVFYRSAQLAFLGTFLAIYLALQDETQPSRFGSVSQRRQPTPTSTLESIQQHLTSVRESVQKHLTYQNLTYRPSHWPPDTLAQCMPFVGHIFAHQSAMHLAMNSVSFYFVTSFLFPSMGIFTTAMTFLAGGMLASQLDCATAKAYANPRSSWHNVVGSLHASPRDPNPNGTLNTGRLGASAGICAMFTVLAISYPMARGRFLLLPGSIPIWMFWFAEVAWEGYNFYNDVEDGIGHGGHLAGHAAGAILWLMVLRWTPHGRWRRAARWE